MVGGAPGHRQRLKDRFLAGEAPAFADEALLELLLTYAIPQKDVQPLAKRLLAGFGSLRSVLAADRAALRGVEGVGEHVAALLELTAWIGIHQLSGQGAEVHATQPRLAPDLHARVPVPVQTELFAPVAPPLAGQAGSMPEVARDRVSAAAPSAEQAGTRPEAAPDRAPAVASSPRAAPSPERAARHSTAAPRWRATGPYNAANASKAGLVEETRLALLAYARLRDRAAVRRDLLDGGLPQRSRVTRQIIVRVIQERLVDWHPPAWVCDDLVASAETASTSDLQLLLLLHSARQDALLYDVVQEVVWPKWRDGVTAISRVDVQRLLDGALPAHPEIDGWSLTTREKLAGNLLTILRDYGLLHGTASKRIVEPVVSPRVVAHLARLLGEEGVAASDLSQHPDWQLWLLDPVRVGTLLARASEEGSTR